MKKNIILTAAAALLLFSCDKEQLTLTETYSDMRITEFSYPAIPSEGGTIPPTETTYSYKAATTDGRTEQRAYGAALSYSCNDDRFVTDITTGKITAGPNTTMSPISFEVTVKITKGTATAEKTVTVTQEAATEDITNSRTVQLPLVLAPHTCVYPVKDTANKYWLFDQKTEHTYITTRTDGKADRDYFDQINPNSNIVNLHNTIGIEPEYVSTRGVQISVSGGELVTINRYRSGKVDTVILKTPVFSTSTAFSYINEGMYDKQEESQNPSSSFSTGTWTIAPTGYGRYTGISHTLTATAGTNTVSLTINQHDNYAIGSIPDYLVFNSHSLRTQRDNWPNYEDYPVGSSPKWPKMKDIYGGDDNDFFPYRDTKDLHPDGNRTIAFTFSVDYDHMSGRKTYLSGAISEAALVQHYARTAWLRGGVTVTAEADVKLTDGTTAHVQHTSKWVQPLDRNFYNGRYEMDPFAASMPVIEDAAEDFIWTVKFSLDLPEDQIISWCRLGDQSNFFDYDWTFPTYTFKDCRYTTKEYVETKKLSGIFAGSMLYESNMGDSVTNTIIKNGIVITITD